MRPRLFRSRLVGVLLASLFLTLTACGDDTSGDPDAGPNPDVQDASTSDSGADAGRTDAGDDAGMDPGTDAGTDAGGDPGTDAGTDAGTSVCGDGVKQPPETCDDGNTVGGDGCDATCGVEPGWNCSSAGDRCHAAACGDRIVAGIEECEDGNTVAGDGCGASCRLESGYKCPTVGQACVRTFCGDQVIEGTEQCDDGNNDLGDGCSTLCEREPLCANGVCQAVCGDGVMLPGSTTEECDDGNTHANDGCSPTCRFEEGFTCQLIVEAPPAQVFLPVVYRDFRGQDLPATGSLPRGHIDFENASSQETGIVAATLGNDDKPVYAKEGVSSNTTHGRTAFDQWYRDIPNVNRTVVQTLPLARQPNGAYVFDDPTFFPLDDQGWVALGHEIQRPDFEGTPHNFSFTSETRYWFEYKGTEVLSFRGDDDLWVFINRRLALDLGGVHGALEGTVALSQRAGQLDLTVGGIYEVSVFQAERHTTSSTYRLTLTNFTTRRTVCVPNCGDGIAQAEQGEECDDGVNDGGYGQCAPG